MKSFLNTKKPSVSQLEKYLLCTPKSTNLASSNLPVILKETSSKFNPNENFNDENNLSLSYNTPSFVSSSETTDNNTKSFPASRPSVLVCNSKKEILYKSSNEVILRSKPIEEIDINSYPQCTTGSSSSDKAVDSSRSFENAFTGFRFLKSSARNSTELSIDSPYDKNKTKEIDHITGNGVIENVGKSKFVNYEQSKDEDTKQICNNEANFSKTKYKKDVNTSSFEYNSKQTTSINLNKAFTSSRYTERSKNPECFKTEYKTSKIQIPVRSDTTHRYEIETKTQQEPTLHVARRNFERNKDQDSPLQLKSSVSLEQSNRLKFRDSVNERDSSLLSLENENVYLGELVRFSTQEILSSVL
jgi:hypothetical protein